MFSTLNRMDASCCSHFAFKFSYFTRTLWCGMSMMHAVVGVEVVQQCEQRERDNENRNSHLSYDLIRLIECRNLYLSQMPLKKKRLSNSIRCCRSKQKVFFSPSSALNWWYTWSLCNGHLVLVAFFFFLFLLPKINELLATIVSEKINRKIDSQRATSC